MKANDLLDILGDADDGMIAEAKAMKKNKVPVWAKWCAAAACLCIAVLSIILPKLNAETDPAALVNQLAELGINAEAVSSPRFTAGREMPAITQDDLLLSMRNNTTVQGTISSLKNVRIEDADNIWYITAFDIAVDEVLSGEINGDTAHIVCAAQYTGENFGSHTVPINKLIGCREGTKGVFVIREVGNEPWNIFGKEVAPKSLGEYYIVYSMKRSGDVLTCREQNVSVLFTNNAFSAFSQAAAEPYRLYTDRIILPEITNGGAEYDMIGCLVYKGSVYTQGSTVVDEAYAESLVGEYVGEAKGTLDEWSSQAEWATEFASTYSGSVYTVKGYDENFRLCLWIGTDDAKWLQIMENFDGIGLNTGNDLFEERFHIKNNIASVTYLTHYDWNYNGYFEHEYKPLDSVTQEQLDEFVDTLCASPFVHIDYDESPEFYDTEKQGHLFLKMDDGTQIELRLIDGGYVGYQGLGWFFVTMPGEIFETILNACQ